MKIIASYFQINTTTFITFLLEQSYNLTRTTKNTVATFYSQMRTDTRNAFLIIREKQLQSPDMINNTSNKMYLHEHTTKFYTIRQNCKVRNSIYFDSIFHPHVFFNQTEYEWGTIRNKTWEKQMQGRKSWV